MRSTPAQVVHQERTPRLKTPPPTELSPPITPPASPPQSSRVVQAPEAVPENYVEHFLKTVPPLPPITRQNFLSNVEWVSLFALTLTPALGIYGAFTTPLVWRTGLFSVFWYFVTGYVDRNRCPLRRNADPPTFRVDWGSLQDIIASGPIVRITPASPWNTRLQSLAQAVSKGPSNGGPAGIGHTIGTRTPNSTLTMPIGVSFIRISDGYC